jgi:hypothetical protein
MFEDFEKIEVNLYLKKKKIGQQIIEKENVSTVINQLIKHATAVGITLQIKGNGNT